MRCARERDAHIEMGTHPVHVACMMKLAHIPHSAVPLPCASAHCRVACTAALTRQSWHAHGWQPRPQPGRLHHGRRGRQGGTHWGGVARTGKGWPALDPALLGRRLEGAAPGGSQGCMSHNLTTEGLAINHIAVLPLHALLACLRQGGVGCRAARRLGATRGWVDEWQHGPLDQVRCSRDGGGAEQPQAPMGSLGAEQATLPDAAQFPKRLLVNAGDVSHNHVPAHASGW